MKKSILRCFFCLTVLVAALQPYHAAATSLPPAPSLSGITPASFPAGINTPVTITGDHLDGVVSAQLGTLALTGLQADGSGLELKAQVPWSIRPGIYDLSVTDASGQSASLPGAVTVTAEAQGWASNGPWGGRLYTPSMDPQDPDRIFVSGWDAGLFLTSDAGASWSYNFINSTSTVHFYYPTPGQPPVLYVDGNGLYRSTDNGQTWQDTRPFDCGNSCSGTAAALDPSHPDWVFLAARSNPSGASFAGLYKSTDRGDSWTQIPATAGWNLMSVALDPDEANHILVGTDDGKLYSSIDGGDHWSDPVQVGTYIGRLVFSPTLYNGKRSLWAVQNDVWTYQGDQIYRSSDGGSTWDKVTVNASGNYEVMGMAYHPSIPGLAWAPEGDFGVGDLFVTQDDGATWTDLNAQIGWIYDILVVPGSSSLATTTLYAATGSGFYKSSDGGSTWQEADTGLGAVMPLDVVVSPFNADEAFAVATSKGVLHTLDGGIHWTQTIPFNGDGDSWPQVMAADSQTAGTYYISSVPHFGIDVTQDDGASYTGTDFNYDGSYDFAEVTALAPHPQSGGHLLAGACIITDWNTLSGWNGAVYASTDGGQSFTLQNTPSDARCINTLAYDPSNLQTVYAGTRAGLLVSSDGGANWSDVPHQPDVQNIAAIAVDPRDSQSIYIYGRGLVNGDPIGLFVTHDGGATWQQMTGLNSWNVYGLQIVPIGMGYWLYANTQSGLFFLPDLPAGPFDPATPWESSSGIAGGSQVTGFVAAAEAGRIVFYIGTSGGAMSNASTSRKPAASTGQNLTAGVYRNQRRNDMVFLPLIMR
ncbi:MAG TPA: hypothetical protein VMT91_01075 [Anaerolineales bacterium]|nr:hypothetical protein [Anaerolineales bacterium]